MFEDTFQDLDIVVTIVLLRLVTTIGVAERERWDPKIQSR